MAKKLSKSEARRLQSQGKVIVMQGNNFYAFKNQDEADSFILKNPLGGENE